MAWDPYLFLLHPRVIEVFFIPVCGKHYQEVREMALLPTKNKQRETSELKKRQPGSLEVSLQLASFSWHCGIGFFQRIASEMSEGEAPELTQ